MQHWDPLGVGDAREAADEYDDYVGRIYALLMSERADAEAVAPYLIETATGRIGLPLHPELVRRGIATATVLVAMRPGFEIH